MNRCLWILLYQMMSTHLFFAQLDTMQFKKYTSSEGLSDNSITSILQDQEGYLWIGTVNGLNRFDGTKFQNYFQGQKPFYQPGNYINKLIPLPGNSIGVATRRGFMKMNCHDFTSQSYLLKDSSFFCTYLNSVSDATELEGNRYAISTQTGFYAFEDNGSLFFRYDHFTAKDLSNKRVAYGRDLMKLSEHEVFIYTNKYPALFNTETKKLRPLKYSDRKYTKLFPDENQWTIRKQLNQKEYLFISFKNDSLYYVDLKKNKKTGSPLGFHADDELYWASYIFPYNDSTFLINGKYGGVFVFYLNKTTGYARVNLKKQLQHLRCNWIFKDKEDRLWIGTAQGLFKQCLRPRSVSSIMFHDSKTSEGNAFFDNVCATEKYIFMSRPSNTEALYVIDKKAMTIQKTFSFYGGINDWNKIINMRLIHPDTLWISCVPGILWLNTKTLEYGKINLPEELKNKALVLGNPGESGEMWMCGYLRNLAVCYSLKKRSFLVYNNNTKPAFLLPKPKHIIYDSDQNVWFGGHGMSSFNRTIQKFDTLMNYFAGPNKFEDNMLCASSDCYGYLWFHVVDNGLIGYNTRQKKFNVFSSEQDISNSEILMMSPVIKDKLWFVTRSKIHCFDVKTHVVTILDESDGLPEDYFTGSEIFYDSLSQKLYAGMNNYLVSFPAEIKEFKNIKQLKIDKLVLKNGEVIYQPKDTIQLNYDQNTVTIHLSVLDYETKTPYQFSYTLNDTLINNKISDPAIRLSNLDDGLNNFTFRAKDKYNKTLYLRLVIKIHPPYWRTWWFLLLCSVLSIGVIYVMVKLRLKKLNREAKLNQQLSEYELKALHAQMNPHFIFNCLNSIKALIMYGRNEEATTYLNRFASLVRLNLDHSRKQFLTLQQNIEYLKQYLEIEALRFNDLNYNIYTAPNVDTLEIKIAPMLLQPLIENAIWHGLQALPGDKKLSIHFTCTNNLVSCEIEDNGLGINRTRNKETKNHHSIGIENIRQRIKLLNEKYNLNYSLEISDLSENGSGKNGTLVKLSFNYI